MQKEGRIQYAPFSCAKTNPLGSSTAIKERPLAR